MFRVQTYITKYIKETLSHVLEDFGELLIWVVKGFVSSYFKVFNRNQYTYNLNWQIEIAANYTKTKCIFGDEI